MYGVEGIFVVIYVRLYVYKCIVCLTFDFSWSPLAGKSIHSEWTLIHNLLEMYPSSNFLDYVSHFYNIIILLLYFDVDSVVSFDQACCSSFYVVLYRWGSHTALAYSSTDLIEMFSHSLWTCCKISS